MYLVLGIEGGHGTKTYNNNTFQFYSTYCQRMGKYFIEGQYTNSHQMQS